MGNRVEDNGATNPMAEVINKWHLRNDRSGNARDGQPEQRGRQRSTATSHVQKSCLLAPATTDCYGRSNSAAQSASYK